MKSVKVLLGVFLFWGCFWLISSVAFGETITNHEFVAKIDSGGRGYHVSSLSQEVKDKYPHRFKYYLYVMVRQNGKWKVQIPPTGAKTCDWETMEHSIMVHSKALVNIIDEIIPMNEVVSFSWIICEHEAVIYLQPDKWYNKEVHEKLAEELNKRREMK